MKPTVVTLTGGDENQKTVATYEEAFGGEYSEAEGGDWQDYSFNGETFLSAEGEEFSYNAEGDYFYNAKGEKFKKGMGKIGKGFTKVGKAISKGFKKFVGKFKPKKGARKLRQDKRADKRSTKQKEYAEKKAKRDKDIADAKAKGQTPPPPLPPPTKEERGGDTGGANRIVDVIPPVINGEKINPDGSKTAVPPADQTKVGNVVVDKKDIQGSNDVAVETNPTTGAQEVVAVVDPSNVETLKTEDGEELQFKKSDLITNPKE